ncbi:YtxH domain-containing protein [Rhodoflexus caldus]|jgi:gas vesicle protein|uniref:YtxH domain-containing protein n=1 Tax=Rhodoflexus caldus TaxID=2891236 RepID=UPI00202A1832|nr:YtxH domain-containing protein [Rhodoflexus caldus]
MSKAGRTLLGFIAGAATGIVAGMLFAPDKGINTRDRLSYRLDKYLDALKELMETLKEKKDEPINSAKADGQRVVGDILKEAEKIYSDMHDLEFRIKQK